MISDGVIYIIEVQTFIESGVSPWPVVETTKIMNL